MADVYDGSREGQTYDPGAVTMVVCVRPGCDRREEFERGVDRDAIMQALEFMDWRQVPQPFTAARAEHGDPANHVELPAFECPTCAAR